MANHDHLHLSTQHMMMIRQFFFFKLVQRTLRVSKLCLYGTYLSLTHILHARCSPVSTPNQIAVSPQTSFKLHCDETATSGTWYARDNTANFLKWCRSYGMTDEMLFDTEDLGQLFYRQYCYCYNCDAYNLS